MSKSATFIDINAGTTRPYTNAVFSEDGALFAFVNEEYQLQIIDVRTGARLFSVPFTMGGGGLLQFNSNGSRLIGSYRDTRFITDPAIIPLLSVTVWDAHTGQVIRSFPKAASAVLGNNEQGVFLIELPSRDIVLYDIESGAEVNRFAPIKGTEKSLCLAGTYGTKLLYSSTADDAISGYPTITIGCLNTETGVLLPEVAIRGIDRMEYSATGMKWLGYKSNLTTPLSDSVISYDLATLQPLHAQRLRTTTMCAINPTGTHFANQDADTKLEEREMALYSMADGTMLQALPSKGVGACAAICFSADDSYLAGMWFNGRDFIFRIWQIP